MLARNTAECHPSRRGDLHWVGATFPAWLAEHLAGTEYAWLGDLARLEWLCEESMASRCDPALPIGCLADVPADRVDALRIRLQPSLRSMSSRYPVGSVWQANQGAAPAAPVDLALGPEHCAIACLDERVTVYRLETAPWSTARGPGRRGHAGGRRRTGGRGCQRTGRAARLGIPRATRRRGQSIRSGLTLVSRPSSSISQLSWIGWQQTWQSST